MMKKLVLTSLLLLNFSFVCATDIEPSKIPTVKPANSYKNGIYCPAPYTIIRPCVKCKLELRTSSDGKRHRVDSVCLEYQDICSNEKDNHPAFQPNDNFCGEKEFYKNLSPEIKKELRIK